VTPFFNGTDAKIKTRFVNSDCVSPLAAKYCIKTHFSTSKALVCPASSQSYQLLKELLESRKSCRWRALKILTKGRWGFVNSESQIKQDSACYAKTRHFLAYQPYCEHSVFFLLFSQSQMPFCVLSDVHTVAHKDRMTLTDLYMQYSAEVCVSIREWKVMPFITGYNFHEEPQRWGRDSYRINECADTCVWSMERWIT